MTQQLLVVDYFQQGLILILNEQLIAVELDIPNIKELFPIGKTLPYSILTWVPKYGPS